MTTGPTAPADVLESAPFPAISRLALALYCGGSGDHNPLHVDSDAAQAAGFDDVIAHGMLPMAYLGRFLTETFGDAALLRLHVRFTAMTHVGDRLTCRAERVESLDGAATSGPGAEVDYEVQIVDQNAEVKLAGRATVRL